MGVRRGRREGRKQPNYNRHTQFGNTGEWITWGHATHYGSYSYPDRIHIFPKINEFYLLCINLRLHECMCTMSVKVLTETRNTGVTGWSWATDVGAGDWTWVPWRAASNLNCWAMAAAPLSWQNSIRFWDFCSGHYIYCLGKGNMSQWTQRTACRSWLCFHHVGPRDQSGLVGLLYPQRHFYWSLTWQNY